MSPTGAGPAPQACGVPIQPPSRLGGGSGEFQRGVRHPLRPLPTPLSGLFAFKEIHSEENRGRFGHAFPPRRLGHTTANQGADAPPCGCGVLREGAGVWGSCPEPGEGEPVQEVTGAVAAAEAAVAVFSATAAEAPASARAAQQTITGLENEPGRVSFGGSLEAPPARGPVQSRVLSSGRLERSSRAGPVGVQAALRSPLEPASRTVR